jgi:hypothetical protein
MKSKLIFNKANGQININLLKKKLPTALKKDLPKVKNISWKLEGWETW